MDLPFETGDESDEGAAETTVAPSVLIVDDEPVVLEVLKRFLGREKDLELVSAESAEEALALLSKRRFDLLMTDKNLPGMSGIALVGEARGKRPALEAIIMTGYASAESVIDALAAGASDYLTKPFDDLAVVRAKVRAALDRHSTRAQGRHEARALASEAAKLLTHGKSVSDSVWKELEQQLAAYEAAPKQAADGKVLAVGKPETLALIRSAGFQVEAVRTADDPEVAGAEAVVIDEEWPLCLVAAERFSRTSAEVLLVARPNAELGDLLDAIALKVELVGFGSAVPQSVLAARVKALLLRRTVQRAQSALRVALAKFRAALGDIAA